MSGDTLNVVLLQAVPCEGPCICDGVPAIATHTCTSHECMLGGGDGGGGREEGGSTCQTADGVHESVEVEIRGSPFCCKGAVFCL